VLPTREIEKEKEEAWSAGLPREFGPEQKTKKKKISLFNILYFQVVFEEKYKLKL
jgi:hypothetical protein